MASFLPEEELLCPVCYDIFSDPVLLPCSHSYCRVCIQKCWFEKGQQECPSCRKISSAALPCNLILKNLCEAFLSDKRRRESEGADVICPLHSEKLKVFCLEDRKPICVVCRDSNAHSRHTFRPVDEAAADLKEEVKAKLLPFQEKLKAFKDVKHICDETAKYLKTQTENTERVIKREFAMLRQFLYLEEAVRLAALREEQDRKSQMMKANIDELSREIAFLTASIRTIEEQIHSKDITFLQNYKATMKRAQCSLQNPQMVPGALINVAKHIANMKFNVWEKMQSLVTYTPVVMDPCTAHSSLVLSEDLSSVKLSNQTQQLPDNPERFSYYQFVLGAEGFSSGRHSWQVEVGQCPEWALGVATASAQVKGEGFLLSGVWRLWYSHGQFRTDSPAHRYRPLKMAAKPRCIKVELDWDKGTLSFYNLCSTAPLYTFYHHFIERLYPIFGNGSGSHNLSIAPLKMTLKLA